MVGTGHFDTETVLVMSAPEWVEHHALVVSRFDGWDQGPDGTACERTTLIDEPEFVSRLSVSTLVDSRAARVLLTRYGYGAAAARLRPAPAERGRTARSVFVSSVAAGAPVQEIELGA